MALKFSEYINSYDIDYSKFGEINETHEYSNYVCSVMDKVTFYTKRNYHLMNSSLNESAKRIYNQDIKFSHNEKIAIGCIFNEMLKKYEENYKKELSLCENIINNGYLLEEGVEYDYDTLVNVYDIEEGIGSWLKDKFQKGKDAVANTTKKVIDNAKDLTVKSVKVVRAKSNDLVDWAKQAKKDFTEKYETLKKLVENIVKDGVNTVSDFINHILEVFTKIGDNLCEVVKKLGGLDKESVENGEVIDSVNELQNVKNEKEKSFISRIVERAEAMISKDSENTKKLMTESYEPYMIDESIVDNKFIAWLSGYKSNGVKMNWWKSILIGLGASLVVWMLPKVLTFAGLGAALTMFITALVGVTWNGIGFLKLIYRRNKERKPGEKFFNLKTSIFFGLCVLSTAFSGFVFTKTVTPFLQELCNTMGWTGGDDMSKFGEMIYKITKGISPKDCFTEGGLVEVSEKIKNLGGDFRGNDIIQSNTDAVNAMKDMAGASSDNVSAYNDFLTAMQNAKGSSGVLKAAQEFTNNPDLPTTFMLDTSKWGGSGPIKQAIEELSANDTIPDSTILTTGGSLATQKASKGVYGFCSFLTGLTKDQANDVFQRAAEIAGVDANTIHMHAFGLGTISDVITHTETVNGIFDVIVPNVPFLPIVIPFFDKKKWGKYALRFESKQGKFNYTVDSVEVLPVDKIKETSPAFNILQSYHNDSWKSYQNEEPDGKKVEEPQYIVFFVDPDNKKLDEGKKNKDDNDTKKVGVVIDTLTMMVADVCDFNYEARSVRRPKPYFMKGLFSKLSFKPVDFNDNETKEYIRETLGQTMRTLILQNIIYGNGRKYIDAQIKGKEGKYEIRSVVLGKKTKINPDKKVFDLGNFTPNEIMECLMDKSENNKVAYDFLDGKYASNASITTDVNGKVVSKSVSVDADAIENVKYYYVSNKAYKTMLDEYEQKKKDYKSGKIIIPTDEEIDKYEQKLNDDVKNGKISKSDAKIQLKEFKKGKPMKRPSKPHCIKGDDGRWYMKASKQMMNDKKYKKKKLYDFVDMKIVPALKKGELYNELVKDKDIKKLLYKDNDNKKIQVNKEVITVLKPFLYRPEKTFAEKDEHKLAELLKKYDADLNWFKKLFGGRINNVFKKAIEIIWDYLRDGNKKVNEGYETIFDGLAEDYMGQEIDDDENYEYDLIALNEDNSFVLSRDEFIIQYGY
jgi:uncharacterized protein YoxC